MMIRPGKLRWKNFMAVGNDFIEIDLDATGSTLVVGPNGSGKSSWIDAYFFVVTGKAFRDIKKKQLVNSITQKNCVVEHEFKVGNTDYMVRRGISPGIFEIYKNGVLVPPPASAAEYQDILMNQILRADPRTLRQVAILGTVSFTPFMQLPTWERRKVIEDILDLQVFSRMAQVVKDKINSVEKELESIDHDKRLVREKIKLVKKHLMELQKNSDDAIEEKRQQILDALEKAAKVATLMPPVRAEIKELEEALKRYDQIPDKLRMVSDFRSKLLARKSVLERDLRFFGENESCPTCKQGIDEHFKHESVSEKTEKLQKTTTDLDRLDSESQKLDDLQVKSKKIRQRLTEKQFAIHDHEREFEALNKSVVRIQLEIDSAKAVITTENKNQLIDLDKEFQGLETKQETLTKKREDLAIMSRLLKDDGLKANAIRKWIPKLNAKINEYLTIMDFPIIFTLNEEFEETIESRFRSEFSYYSFSEGQKARINLAILFAWRDIAKRRNSVNMPLVVLDEVMDGSLDENGLECLYKLMGELKDDRIFVISHRADQAADRFDRTLHFTLHRNFSQMSESVPDVQSLSAFDG